ncbi:MAG: hypothetical protein HYV09_35420 [Deltaproteobacteria bacterium]|nr:hypothetical protein [Deltaproteobacteria bacterium]
MRIHFSVGLVLAALTCSAAASAQEPAKSADGPAPSAAEPAKDAGAAPTGPTPAVKKAGYALPYAMRPAIAPNLARIDANYLALKGSTAFSSLLTGGYKPIASIPDLGFYARAGVVGTSMDGLPGSGTAVTNPLFFALYTPEIAPKVRLPIFAGVTAPIGSGGGNSPDPKVRNALATGIYARQAMDNALFATNYLTPTVGAGIAFIDKGLTVQAEVTVLQLMRVRGDKIDGDKSRTNFTSGVNVGYLVLPPHLTISAELHYQRWLSTPKAVEADEARPADVRLGLRDQLTVGGGLRANIPLDAKILMRPGIAYFRGLDDPMAKNRYSIIQIDVPIAF